MENFRFQSPSVGLATETESSARRVRVMVVSSLAMAGAWLAAVSYFGEWLADWWHISIWLFGAALIAAVCVILLKLGWLRYPAANWMLWLIVIYFVLSMGLGAYFTEAATNGGIPRTVLAQEHPGQRYDDNYRYSRSGYFYYNYWYVGSRTPTASSGSSVSCTGKSCGGAALVIVLVILLLASALIPHFWVIAALAGIVLMLLCLRREKLAPSEARALENQDAWADSF